MQVKEVFSRQVNKKSLILVLILGVLVCGQVFAKDLIQLRASLNDYIKNQMNFPLNLFKLPTNHFQMDFCI